MSRLKTWVQFVRIMNGTIVRDDPAAPIPAALQALMNATKSGEANLDIRPTAPDAMRQCEGQLVLLRGGKQGNDFAVAF